MSGLGANNLNTNNLNLNLNLNLAAAAAAGSGGRIRYNTSDYRKLLDPAGALVPGGFAALRFSVNWDANLRTYPYLIEFIEKAHNAWVGGGVARWIDHLKTLAGATTPPHALSQAALEQQILMVLDRAADRDDRFAEIIDQHDAEGAINYWLGMLLIDPARHPKTYLLIRVAARIGETVVMALKDHWRAARPSQFCPGIVPMIDPPSTPAYPAGHALQSRLISKFLQALDAGRPQPKIPQPNLLIDLANRIAENRVIAGIHFPIDNDAGRVIADACFNLVWPSTGPTGTLGQLVTDARAE
jgi:hypothetical protein